VFGSALSFLRGLILAARRNMQQMSEVQDDVDQQDLQYLVSQATWDHQAVQDQLTHDADLLLGGHEDSMLLLDESGFGKKGKMSAGVARQWNGRLGKVDNCQVGVFGALCRGTASTLIQGRLYLPESWTDDPKRCAKAHIPVEHQSFISKSSMALEIVKRTRECGARFAWVGADAGYGKEPKFLRSLADAGERFMVNVHRNQRFYAQDPQPSVPEAASTRGRTPTRLTTAMEPLTAETWAKAQSEDAWDSIDVRHSTAGVITVRALRRTAWMWNSDEQMAREWTLLVIHESGPDGKISYALTNAAKDLPLRQLVQADRQRFWVEQAFGDTKSELGLAEYEARGWLSWHRHMTLCMMAQLFMVETRIQEADAIPMLSARDIRTALAQRLAAPGSSDIRAFENIANRQAQRWASTRSRYEKQGIQPTLTRFANSIM
jgi:SRSO17 transposase